MYRLGIRSLLIHLAKGKTTVEGSHAVETDMSLPTLLADFLAVIQHLFPDPASAPALLVRWRKMQWLTVAPRSLYGCRPDPLCCSDATGQRVRRSRRHCPRRRRRYSGRGIAAHEDDSRPTAYELQIGTSSHRMAVSRYPTLQLTPASLTSNSIRNLESARVSVPSFLTPSSDLPGSSERQAWRTDLLATAPYWARALSPRERH